MMKSRYFLPLITTLFLPFALLLWQLLNPYDNAVWRTNIRIPVIGTVPVRVYPMLQAAASLPGRNLLKLVKWQSSYGPISFSNRQGALEIICEPCAFHLPQVTRQTVPLSSLRLTIRLIENQLSGRVEINRRIPIFYTGSASSHRIDIRWSLPETGMNKLAGVFEAVSPVVKQAEIKGKLAASGTFILPGAKWSANPEINGFSVSGLGTEKLKNAEIVFRCPSTLVPIGRPAAYRWLNINRMGRWLPRAVIIAEDAEFKTHPGYNLNNLRSILMREDGRKQLGGSTLSQQLAKNFFTGGERTWLRKLEELFLAVEMENTLGKQRILSLYLNSADWGPGICGAAQAAQTYFNRLPEQLTPAQAAWLASIIRNPHKAWQEQFLPQTPDQKRLEWIMSYFPKKARKIGLALDFKRFEWSELAYI